MLPEELEIGKQYYCYSRLDKEKNYKIILQYEGIRKMSNGRNNYMFYDDFINTGILLEEDDLSTLNVYEKI